jgi:hypothetical protein
MLGLKFCDIAIDQGMKYFEELIKLSKEKRDGIDKPKELSDFEEQKVQEMNENKKEEVELTKKTN